MALRRCVIVLCFAVALLGGIGEARASIVFVDQAPPVLQRERGAQARVELLNANRSPQRVSLRAVGGPEGEVTIAPVTEGSASTPGGKPKKGQRAVEGIQVSGGDVRAFTITLDAPPTTRAARSLLAGSTDGTVARVALQIGQPPNLPAYLPKTFDIGVREVGKSTTAAFVGLPRVEEKTSVGTLYDAGRHHVEVTVDPPSVITVAGAPAPGTYSGKIDLNGAVDGGASTLTLHARDGWRIPLLCLLFGIGIGYAIEWWLTRLRPRALLDRRLGRLVDRSRRRQKRVDKSLKDLFVASRPGSIGQVPENQAWCVPRVVAEDKTQVSRYHLSRAGMELARGLKAARTDPERELFGPDGDRMKELLADESTYAELVGDLREAAENASPALNDLRNVGHVPMRVRLDYECRPGSLVTSRP